MHSFAIDGGLGGSLVARFCVPAFGKAFFLGRFDFPVLEFVFLFRLLLLCVGLGFCCDSFGSLGLLLLDAQLLELLAGFFLFNHCLLLLLCILGSLLGVLLSPVSF